MRTCLSILACVSLAFGSSIVACGGGEPAKVGDPSSASNGTTVSVTPPSSAAPIPAEPPPPAASVAPAVAPASEEGPAIVVEPFKLTPVKKPEKSVEAKADGTVSDKSGKVAIKFVKNEVQTPDGEWVLRVQKDGSVVTRTKIVEKQDGKVVSEKWNEETIGKLDDHDAFAIAQGGKLWFDDKGALKAEGIKGPSPTNELKFDGVNAKNRRAATLLLVTMFTAGTVTTDTSSAKPASAPATPGAAASSPAPKKK